MNPPTEKLGGGAEPCAPGLSPPMRGNHMCRLGRLLLGLRGIGQKDPEQCRGQGDAVCRSRNVLLGCADANRQGGHGASGTRLAETTEEPCEESHVPSL